MNLESISLFLLPLTQDAQGIDELNLVRRGTRNMFRCSVKTLSLREDGPLLYRPHVYKAYINDVRWINDGSTMPRLKLWTSVLIQKMNLENALAFISDLMQGFTISQVINYMVFISVQDFFYHIVIVHVRNYHNMVKKYCLEALHEKKKNWSHAWDHWFRAWDAQCMCTINHQL